VAGDSGAGCAVAVVPGAGRAVVRSGGRWVWGFGRGRRRARVVRGGLGFRCL
jgi:hypothetical protein